MRNRDECLGKLQEALQRASIVPKERKMKEGISEKTKRERRDEKRKRGEVKQLRKKVNWDD